MRKQMEAETPNMVLRRLSSQCIYENGKYVVIRKVLFPAFLHQIRYDEQY